MSHVHRSTRRRPSTERRPVWSPSADDDRAEAVDDPTTCDGWLHDTLDDLPFETDAAPDADAVASLPAAGRSRSFAVPVISLLVTGVVGSLLALVFVAFVFG